MDTNGDFDVEVDPAFEIDFDLLTTSHGSQTTISNPFSMFLNRRAPQRQSRERMQPPAQAGGTDDEKAPVPAGTKEDSSSTFPQIFSSESAEIRPEEGRVGTDAFVRPPSPERIRRGGKVFSNKRGPVESPELWAWSSYRYYFLGEAAGGPSFRAFCERVGQLMLSPSRAL